MFEHELFIVVSYGILGAGIKYIDQAYDLEVFSKPKANVVAVLCGILGAYCMITDITTLQIFLAILFSLAITRKIDNVAFYIATGLSFALLLFLGGIAEINWFPFGILVISGVLDELGNDWADKRILKRAGNIRFKNDDKAYIIVEKLFTYRFAMKIAIFLLVVFAYINWIYFFAFIIFDLMYALMEAYSIRVKVYNISSKHIKSLH